MKKFLLLVLVLAIALFSLLMVKTLMFKSKQAKVAGEKIPDPDPAAPGRLSEAVRFATISYDDRKHFDSIAFNGLVDFLGKSFPLCDSLLEKNRINRYSLVYAWKGKNPQLKPALLLAHMDVVPADGKWEQDPFSGKIDQDFIWGRGTLDDKLSVLGILEAAEKLLKEKYTPERTIYFAFGHDEEAMGESGAHQVAAWMQQRNIQPEFVLDEGLVVTEGIVPGMTQPVALIGIAEKGYITLRLHVQMHGGHSSMPEAETAIGVLCKGIAKIEQHPFDARITPPLEKFLEYLGPEMPFFKRMVFANPWLFKPFIVGAYEKTASGNASIRTTAVASILKAGIKENVVPDYAEAVINIRPLPGDAEKDIVQRLTRLMEDERIKIQVLKSIPPSEVSGTDTKGFQAIDRSIREVFPDAIVAPALMIGGTDSKHYAPLSKNIYRFLPIRLKKEDLSRIHGQNERISLKGYNDVIRFYYSLLHKI